ncbi:MAG: tyrosine-type recombinase/integrase [Deltaproteobacteria bacterium]|nr:tyrosine-type recombinase/integrase [Deltaproteobacteria bacterium]MBW2382508.1 tyrosine-type recombinase/integrase [Deltaproteobacteria bacterium]MBW2697067.1 tyrosine-type recombinase/integrase [Deltaproteobacteria bacterium]
MSSRITKLAEQEGLTREELLNLAGRVITAFGAKTLIQMGEFKETDLADCARYSMAIQRFDWPHPDDWDPMHVDLYAVEPAKVLTHQELEDLLHEAHEKFPESHPLILFLADTGVRLGEATGLRWIDVDLQTHTARICRSYSSGTHLGPTKTGRERVVELSSRLVLCLAHHEPNVFPHPEDALVFPNSQGGFLGGHNFRYRVFSKLVAEVLGKGRRFTPHGLRHYLGEPPHGTQHSAQVDSGAGRLDHRQTLARHLRSLHAERDPRVRRRAFGGPKRPWDGPNCSSGRRHCRRLYRNR